MKEVCLGLAAASLFVMTGQAHGQSQLPKEVQADMLFGRIDAAVAAGNAQEALAGIADYRQLGVKMPMGLLFLEGRLAAITKDYVRSRKALDEYLARPEARADKNYPSSLALHADLKKAIEMDAKAQCTASISMSAVLVAARQPGTVFRECPFAPEMVIVPAGNFMMGVPPKEKKASAPNKEPERQVNLRVFAVGKFEVTFDEWDACVAAGGCNTYHPSDNNWGRGRQPVINVNWDDAQTYVNWLRQITGKQYRLLSEAEWEYAARSGGDNYTYKITGLDGYFISKKVGSGGVNKFGLSEMTDNVAEWVEDCLHKTNDGAPADGRAWISDNCPERVVRGPPDSGVILSFATRRYADLTKRDVRLGFRIARTLIEDATQ